MHKKRVLQDAKNQGALLLYALYTNMYSGCRAWRFPVKKVFYRRCYRINIHNMLYIGSRNVYLSAMPYVPMYSWIMLYKIIY